MLHEAGYKYTGEGNLGELTLLEVDRLTQGQVRLSERREAAREQRSEQDARDRGELPSGGEWERLDKFKDEHGL